MSNLQYNLNKNIEFDSITILLFAQTYQHPTLSHFSSPLLSSSHLVSLALQDLVYAEGEGGAENAASAAIDMGLGAVMKLR